MRPKRPSLYSAAVVLLGFPFFFSCSRSSGPAPDPTSSRDHQLPSFSVQVIDRSPTFAIIQWVAVNNALTGDSVRYKVTLEGRTIDSNLTKLTDTIRPLVQDTSFNGRVYAYTKAGDTVSAPFFLEILDGFVYLAPSLQANSIRCVDAFSGASRWNMPLDVEGNLEEIPTIVNGVLYINGFSSGTWAINAKTGKKIWNSAASEYAGGSGSPLYLNGTIYTAIGSALYALNSSDGSIKWRYQNEWYNNTAPVVVGNRLIMAEQYNYSHVVAVDISTGSKAWEIHVDGAVCKSPVVYDTLLIFTAGAKTYAVGPSTGQTVWVRDLPGSQWSSPIIYRDLVITYNDKNGYTALKASTGATIWNHPAYSYLSSPAVGDDKIYFSGSEGQDAQCIAALDAATGNLVWKHPLDPQASPGTPIFAHHRLYFGSKLTSSSNVRVVVNAITGDFAASFYSADYSFAYQTVVVKDTTFYPAESGMLQ